MRFTLLFAAATLMAVPALAQQGPGMGQGMGRGMMMQGGKMPFPMARHRPAMMGGIPAPYTLMRNPGPFVPATVEKGRALFAEHCASCHGPQGRGNGEAGKDLDPKPGDLAMPMRMPVGTDPFLMWTIGEGGAALGSAMPAFAEVLSQEERWAIVTFLRASLGPGGTVR